jgi:2-oxoisovalerate dehydrogenase E1 component
MIDLLPPPVKPDHKTFPEIMSEPEFYATAYPYMYLSRRMEETIKQYFKAGRLRGTVTQGIGNEATAVGFSLPLRAGEYPVSFLHRDFLAHIVHGSSPDRVLDEYIANANSPNHGKEGNVHWGDAEKLRFPMISHLGNMLAPVVGATWQRRKYHPETLGLAVIGDGGMSTGDPHEAMNIASVHHVPVLFLVENNGYAFSTPTGEQYHCKKLSYRAISYGIEGKTIDGTNPWEVYSTVVKFFASMQEKPAPKILECTTLRIGGHAAYEDGDYCSDDYKNSWVTRDPILLARQRLRELDYSDSQISGLEKEIDRIVDNSINNSLTTSAPDPKSISWSVFATSKTETVKPFEKKNFVRGPKQTIVPVKNVDAVNLALEYILTNNPNAFILGLDIGEYGSAFHTCNGLVDKFGKDRVINMPICESAITGFALGASQIEGRPIVEYQFADFSTEAATQLGLNSGTWFFRSDVPAPVLFRLPCGGNYTVGPFHSMEFEGIWSRFPGLKVLYPVTPQETFEALVAGFYDPNPCIVLENKFLYGNSKGEINFDGDLQKVWRPRNHRQGNDITVVAMGSMVHESLKASQKSSGSIDIWNPFVMSPRGDYNIMGPIVESVKRTGRLLVVQESQEISGIGKDIIADVTREAYGSFRTAPRLLASLNTPVPFAPILEAHYRPNSQRIEEAVQEMMWE